MNQSLASMEYRTESHVTDRLERENAQLRAVIAEQKNYPHVNDYIAQQYAEIHRLRGVVDEQTRLIRELHDVLLGKMKKADHWTDDVIDVFEKTERFLK